MFFLGIVSAMQCSAPLRVELLSITETESSVYATPLVAPLVSPPFLSILVPTFSQFVELLRDDGHSVTGWPIAFSDASFHASALAHDIDGDGSVEVLVSSSSGKVMWLHLNGDGHYMQERVLAVPRLNVHRDWWVGLDDNAEIAAEFSYEHVPGAHIHHGGVPHDEAGIGIRSDDESYSHAHNTRHLLSQDRRTWS